jgi:nucleoside-diphosphate-sugar epimerase
MNILITGGSGFIGRYVVKELSGIKNKIQVLYLNSEKQQLEDNNDVDWLNADIAYLSTYKDQIKKFDPEVVIHMAWQGIPDFSEAMSKTNLITSTNFLDFIIDETNCKKIIVSGSCFEYGKVNGAVKESDDTNITSYFSWAKQSLYKYLSFKCSENNINLIWFRFFYVYGHGQREASLIPYIIKTFKTKTKLNIGNPYNRNDFINVEDIALAVAESAIDNNKISSGIYNLGSGASTSVYDICRTTEYLITGQEFVSTKLIRDIKKTEYIDFWADLTKTKPKFSWLPKYTIEQGIKKMISYSNKP